MRSASQLARRSSVLPRRMSTPVQQSGDFDELRERSLLRHVIAKSTEGDAASVLSAMDTFWDTYFNGEGTAEWQVRSSALDAAVRAKQPTVAMEIGAYCGYTAVRMGALMPAGGKLISVELDPLYAAIATKIVEHAGLSDRVHVEIGTLADRLPAIHRKYGITGPLGVVLLDHNISSYLPDLKLLESNGHIDKGTAVLCDWSLYPGSTSTSSAPTDGQEFMAYLSEIGVSQSTRHTLRDKEVFTVSAGSWVGVI